MADMYDVPAPGARPSSEGFFSIVDSERAKDDLMALIEGATRDRLEPQRSPGPAFVSPALLLAWITPIFGNCFIFMSASRCACGDLLGEIVTGAPPISKFALDTPRRCRKPDLRRALL